MIMTGGLVILVFVLLIVFAAIKKKPAEPQAMQSPIQQFMQPAPQPQSAPEPAVARFVSMRDQQLAEDAALIASEYQRMQEAKKQEKLQALFAK